METKKNYLNGQWVGSEETIEVVNPATGKSFAKVATVTRDQVKQAHTDAQAAFEGWRSLPAKVRADYLLAVAAELGKRTDEIAKLMTQENGKPLGQSKGEVAMSVDHLRWFAEECRRAYGRVIPNQVSGQAESGDQVAGGRCRGDRAVEFSAGAVGAEGRAGAGGGVPGDFEAGEPDAAVQLRRSPNASTPPSCPRACFS